MTHKVRTTKQPDVELEVDDAEYTDLLRQGLIADLSVPTDPPKARNPRPADEKKENG